MTWPDATYKIVVEGGGSLLGVIFVLAVWTDFWENLFNRGRTVIKEVEVLPDDLVETLEEVIVDLRSMALVTPGLEEIAQTIEDAIHDDE
jgi:hypothetical protein